MSDKAEYLAPVCQLVCVALAIYWLVIGDHVLASIWTAAAVIILCLRARS